MVMGDLMITAMRTYEAYVSRAMRDAQDSRAQQRSTLRSQKGYAL